MLPKRDVRQGSNPSRHKKTTRRRRCVRPFPGADNEKTTSLERIVFSSPSCGLSSPRSNRFLQLYLRNIRQFVQSTGVGTPGTGRKRGAVPQNYPFPNCNPPL